MCFSWRPLHDSFLWCRPSWGEWLLNNKPGSPSGYACVMTWLTSLQLSTQVLTSHTRQQVGGQDVCFRWTIERGPLTFLAGPLSWKLLASLALNLLQFASTRGQIKYSSSAWIIGKGQTTLQWLLELACLLAFQEYQVLNCSFYGHFFSDKYFFNCCVFSGARKLEPGELCSRNNYKIWTMPIKITFYNLH